MSLVRDIGSWFQTPLHIRISVQGPLVSDDDGEVYAVPSSAFSGSAYAIDSRSVIRGEAAISVIGEGKVWHEGIWVSFMLLCSDLSL